MALLVTQENAKADGGESAADQESEDLSRKVSRVKDSLRHQRKQIANLTAIDGATIMTANLDVIAFGAKIIAKPAGELSVSIDYFGSDQPRLENQPLEKLGNTRHQSVARLVAEQPNALGIVVSQDGYMTILAWDGQANTVRALKNAHLASL